MKESTNFGSKIGGVLAAAGSAVGLGNIWRVPREPGGIGGAAFLLIYVLFMVILGVPVMISEISIGRWGGKNVSDSFARMHKSRMRNADPAPNNLIPHSAFRIPHSSKWSLMGFWPIIAGFLVLSYYSVVAGWILEYLYEALTGAFAGRSAMEHAANFVEFSSEPWRPLLFMALMLFATCGIVALGVQKGIERASRLMMPVLFACLALLVLCALVLPGAGAGLRFLFQPDFSRVSGATLLSAMGQAFFSLSVGLCCLCTYGCYFRRDVNLMRDCLSVASIDTLVALMAGLVIFPAVYSVPGLQPDAGPSLIFITLPNVFDSILPAVPGFSYLFALVFYLLLVVAALTSSISMLEMSTSIFVRKFNLPRPLMCVAITLVCLLLGSACSLGFGAWSGVQFFGMDIFSTYDFLVAKYMMPKGAILICISTSWMVSKNTLKAELTNNGTIRQPLFTIYRVIIQYVAPALIALVFANELGAFSAL